MLHCFTAFGDDVSSMFVQIEKKKHIVDLTTSYLRLMRLLCPHSTVHSIPSFGFDCAHVGDCDDVQNMDLFLCLRKTTH